MRKRSRRHSDKLLHVGPGAQRGIALPDPLAFGCGTGWKSEGTGIERQVPTLLWRQPGEAGHAGPINALSNHLVQCEHASLAGAFLVGKCDWRRTEADGCRTFAVPVHAVAARAILREQSPSVIKNGGLRGRERHRVGFDEIGRERASRRRHGRGRSFAGDESLQRCSPVLQIGLRAGGRQFTDSLVSRRRELGHFRELGLADHLASLNSTVIVNRDIVEQSPGSLNRCGIGTGWGGNERGSEQRQDQDTVNHGRRSVRSRDSLAATWCSPPWSGFP